MTEQEQQALCRRIMEGSSQPGWFSNQLKIVYDHLDSRSAEGHIVAEKEHCNPFNIVHGGVYCTLLDQVAGAAACTRGSRGLTVNCETRFLGIAQGDVLCGHAQAIHMGRTLVVMHAWVTDSQDTLCADGTYTFRMKPGFPED